MTNGTDQLRILSSEKNKPTRNFPRYESSIRVSDVLSIIERVEKEGDKAISAYSKAFDNKSLFPNEFKIPVLEMIKAHRGVNSYLWTSIRAAINNIREYQKKIYMGDNSYEGIRYTPIDRIGVCIPGAAYPLCSTVMMTIIPAQIAGVREIAVMSPPRCEGTIHSTILAICWELGVKEVYRVGGSHGVAALGLGTKTIPKVDMIVGPGNEWVQTAKKLLYGRVGIDSISGPSEVLIMANKDSNPYWVAVDMLSQMEHNPGAAIVLTNSDQIADEIKFCLVRMVDNLKLTSEDIDKLLQRSCIVVCESVSEMIDEANALAPEHLEIHCGEISDHISEKIKNAGAIFIGGYSPTAVGDYIAGPSHTLPTTACAKFQSALTVNDFLKSTSIIKYSKEQLEQDAENIIALAEMEGLKAHSMSIKARIKNKIL